MTHPSHELRVGICGFAEAQQRCFADFTILEVQRSFYQPPRLATAQRWRSQAPKGFLFTLKAWQLLTHEASSPTYRRLTEKLSRDQLARTGGLRWNDVTSMAWERTRALANALDAPAIVFQMPRSFLPSTPNLHRIEHFFGHIARDGRRLIFEPRGPDWDDAILMPLLVGLDLVHGVDPFLRAPLGAGLRYFRLHGKPAYHYRYRYTDQDLEQLARRLAADDAAWVLFNNQSMAEDARRLLRILRGQQETCTR